MKRRPIHLFGGCDSASSASLKACDGAWLIGHAADRRDPDVPSDWTRRVCREDFNFNFNFGRILRGFGHSEWAAFIHAEHAQWGFTKVAIDYGAGGGGPEIERRLAVPDQDVPTDIRRINGIDLVTATSRRRCRPIVTPSNFVLEGDPVLMLVSRSDRLLTRLFPHLSSEKKLPDEIFTLFLEGLKTNIGLPRAFTEMRGEEHAGWPQELKEVLKVFEALKNQAAAVTVETDEEGAFIFYAGGAKNFICKGRSDVLKAAMYCYLGFAVWVEAVASGLVADEGAGEVVCEAL